MLEAAIVFIMATGSLVWAARYWQQRKQQTAIEYELEETSAPRQIVSTVSPAGLYSITKPGELPAMAAYTDLHLVAGGMALLDNRTQHMDVFDLSSIQWVSAIELTPERIAAITIHLENNHRWRLLHLHMPESDMVLLVRLLRRFVPQSRMNIGNRPVQPVGPIEARIVEETLHGEVTLGPEVNLYLLPHLLVVLRDDRVRARLDLSSVRRILAVERIGSRLEHLFGTHNTGIVRLYSMNETASFALTKYRQLSQEISYHSRSPVEFVDREDKAEKI